MAPAYPCTRCEISFTNEAAFHSHVFGSLDHNTCKFCPRRDFETFAALQEHLDREHLYCEPCHWFAPSLIGLSQHNASKHNMCNTCGNFFANPHELHGHTAKHRPRNVQCICCDLDFPTISAFFNHMESGTCPSGIDCEDIRNLVGQFYDSPTVLQNPLGLLFFCHSCKKPFKRMCDLLQHSETRSCGEGYFRGTGQVGYLVEYVMRRLRDQVRMASESDEGETSDTSTPDCVNMDHKVIIHGSKHSPTVIITCAA